MFELIKTEGKARRGRFTCPHGEVQTPVFMNVGTQGAIKGALSAADLLNETRRSGGRIVCVGTTSCRTLESLAAEDGSFRETSAWTEIFIYPGYRFKAMDALITNFHLPESTLLMLVSAFYNRDKVMEAYRTAV